MARPVPVLSTFPIHIIPTINIIFAVMIVLCIFSLVAFLCTSHKMRQKEEDFLKKKLAISRKNLLESFSKANSMSSKALMKMVSWRKQQDQHGDYEVDYYDIKDYDYVVVEGDHQGENAVWKKTIIMGEKCKPLDFSGKIEYDSEGNLLPHHDKSVCDNHEMI